MKKMIVAMVAVGLFGAMPVLAAEHEGMKMDAAEHGNMTMDTPDGVRQCSLQAESIQEKIKRLEAEVSSGEKKHNKKDLNKLEKKLKEANVILDQMNRN